MAEKGCFVKVLTSLCFVLIISFDLGDLYYFHKKLSAPFKITLLPPLPY